MNILKRIINKLPLNFRLYIRENIGLKKPVRQIFLNKELRKAFKNYSIEQKEGLYIKDGLKTWYNSFKKFLRAQPEEREVAFEFLKNSISLIKLSKAEYYETDVILLCVVKNDFLKLKNFIEHHRRIGIKHFAILDNNSNDGTREWLKEQQDVDLFYAKDKYTTNRREAWINRLIAYYGLNRWYLILDSDELFTFYNMETKNVESLKEYCEKKSIFRMRAVMIDMYANDSFYSSHNDNDYVEKCRYFDLDTYKYEKRDVLDLVTGGPRGRIFKQNPWLTKYPLCFFIEGEIHGKSHFLFPYYKNKNTKCSVALLHYKFLSADIEKYRSIAKEGNYFNGSIQYKDYVRYIDKSFGLSFMNDKTYEYSGTDSLYKIPILEKIEL